MVLFGVVDKTAGGPNQDIDAAFQYFQLFIVAVAAVGRRAKFQAGGLRRGAQRLRGSVPPVLASGP